MELVSDSVLISDGGLATELEARGHDLSDPLWSARLLVDAPHAITAVHTAYFRAGAQIATTASYQASFEGFAARGIGHDDATVLLRRSVELAQAARDEVGVGGLSVAASVGPYGAALADGSEYRGCYGLSVAALMKWHLPRLEVLVDAGADMLALETIPDIDEAEALVNDSRRATAHRRVCGGRRSSRDRRRRRQLLRTRRRVAGHRFRRRPHRQTGDRVPEQR